MNFTFVVLYTLSCIGSESQPSKSKNGILDVPNPLWGKILAYLIRESCFLPRGGLTATPDEISLQLTNLHMKGVVESELQKRRSADDIRISYFGNYRDEPWFVLRATNFPTPLMETLDIRLAGLPDPNVVLVRIYWENKSEEQFDNSLRRHHGDTHHFDFNKPWFIFRKSTGQIIGSRGEVLCTLPEGADYDFGFLADEDGKQKVVIEIQ